MTNKYDDLLLAACRNTNGDPATSIAVIREAIALLEDAYPDMPEVINDEIKTAMAWIEEAVE